jgi:hypothetical protein
MSNLIDMQAYKDRMRKRHLDELRIRINNMYNSVERIERLMYELKTKYSKKGPTWNE